VGKAIRIFIALSGCGWVWYLAMRLFFVWSGAQKILANPKYQSEKFIKTFTEYEPLPRMAINSSILWLGLMIVGFFVASAFIIVNNKMSGSWVKKGLLFSVVHWMLMTPWFEFYLPYNVMNEPLPLVLLEAGLWLCVAIVMGLFLSFTLNFRQVKSNKRTIIKELPQRRPG